MPIFAEKSAFRRAALLVQLHFRADPALVPPPGNHAARPALRPRRFTLAARCLRTPNATRLLRVRLPPKFKILKTLPYQSKAAFLNGGML
jgi:hypothetical protein